VIRALPLGTTARATLGTDLAGWTAQVALRPMQLLISAPVFLFLAALTAMLLRPPEFKFYAIDRVAFAILVLGVLARSVILHQRVFVFERASWPMLGLALLVLISVMGQPLDNEVWSVLAAKIIVPFALFHVAGLAFTKEQHLRQFELFALIVLAYLSVIAIAFLFGLHWLIFPRFILDEGVGFHAARARGPLLQAVANGVSLNILWLMAINAHRRRHRSSKALLWLLASVPIAILATMTRAVWIAFAASALALTLRLKLRRLSRPLLAVLVLGGAALLIVANSGQVEKSVGDRLEDVGPVEFREEVYAGSWDMFLQRPWFGWGFHQMPAELPRHVSGYHEKVLYPHNTYLELLAEDGVVGFTLYLWLMYEVWRLGRGSLADQEQGSVLGTEFRRVWPIILGVYSLNAAVVVMSYQFVNGLLFTMAGMLAAQNRRAKAERACSR
jgi:O-antigen ligase